jgi:hypothetical protein
MSKKSSAVIFSMVAFLSCPAFAYTGQNYAGATGAQARLTSTTGGSYGWTQPTSANSVTLPRATMSGVARVPQGYAGLPPVSMDSFVQQAGGYRERIYGDEGAYIKGFQRENRIDAGIYYDRNAGLTTGHQSMLPSAWGADEFIGDSEPSMSGDHMPTGANQSSHDPYAPADTPVGGGFYDPSAGTFPGADGR